MSLGNSATADTKHIWGDKFYIGLPAAAATSDKQAQRVAHAWVRRLTLLSKPNDRQGPKTP